MTRQSLQTTTGTRSRSKESERKREEPTRTRIATAWQHLHRRPWRTPYYCLALFLFSFPPTGFCPQEYLILTKDNYLFPPAPVWTERPEREPQAETIKRSCVLYLHHSNAVTQSTPSRPDDALNPINRATLRTTVRAEATLGGGGGSATAATNLESQSQTCVLRVRDGR